MSEYLSKEEVKQWRSSLEKITLEEFAARLGKKIEDAKPTNDLVDIVLHGQPVISTNEDWAKSKTEKISTIAQRAFEREQDIAPSPFSITKLKLNAEDFGLVESKPSTKKTTKKASVSEPKPEKTKKVSKTAKTTKTAAKKATKTSKKADLAKKEVLSGKTTGNQLRDDVRCVFKKALTDREQKVFDYFASHKNEIVYAKDLATLLDLPRDYVYKYIKNLRSKIEGDKLENADKGGFILHV